MQYATRRKNIFDPKSSEPFALSRSKIESYIRCQRCFYLDRRLGVNQPNFPPFNLNLAVDTLLKKEFDTYRASQKPHPLCHSVCPNLVPLQHKDIETWRDPFRGIRYHDRESNFILFGGIDDVWHDPTSHDIFIVDYKATAKEGTVTIDASWQDSYKRQVEIYQWLFEKNNFSVSNDAYFVYANGDSTQTAFNDKLLFATQVIPYHGNHDWVATTLLAIRKLLTDDAIPPVGLSYNNAVCDLCTYRDAAGHSFRSHVEGTVS